MREKEGLHDYTRPKSEEANGRVSKNGEAMQGRLAGGFGPKDSEEVSESGQDALSDEGRAYLADQAGPKIGRASCRERV